MANVSTVIAAAAIRAGVKRYWGDGPRPLNLPGATPNAQWAGPREMHAHAVVAGGAVSLKDTGTIVLEPMPAQIERGQRVLWVDETSQSTAMTMLRWAREHGWDARLSRSRYLSEPTNAGELSRRGRRLEVETVALRLFKDPAGIYLCWSFDVERAKWTPADGLAYARIGERVQMLGPVSITTAQIMLGMKEARKK